MNKTLIYGLVMVLAMGLVSCGNKHKKELNKLLLELADTDKTIDNGDWTTIENYLDSQKTNFRDFYDGDKIDVNAVKEYISYFFEHRRPSKKIIFIGVGNNAYLKVNFFLERSGSMTPYDSHDGDGSFKAAIVQMLNNLPGNNNDNKIYVVNNSINAYPQGFSKFIADNNIFEATKDIGDPSYTDFSKIFDAILNKTGKDELSILVTDMIYSTKSMNGINPQKVFAEAQGMTNAVFKGAVKKKSMLIIKMRGSYSGPYYSYNSPSSGKIYQGHRPYYIVIVGSNDNIARLTTDSGYSSFGKFADMRGYEHEYLFETSGVYKPYYSLLLSNPDIRGRFQPERGQESQITNIEDVEIDQNSGDLRLVLAVDLRKMLIDEDYLIDANNYQIKSDDKITIKEIRKISSKDVTPAEKKYIGSATHIFILEMKEIKSDQNVEIKLLNRLPSWIGASSSDDDTSIRGNSFANTTFGLKYLLQGIYNSYQKNSDGEPYYFDLKIKMDR